ncbi:MAG: site-specific DNA-methyltransferase, partial [Methylococcaceae bacterium]
NSPMIKDWLGKTVDKEDMTRHDKWLCLMMPRLKLLRELLSEDGAIFISIDNNEIHRLRFLMDDVFGENNFVTQIANINNPKGRSDDRYVPTAHEYLLVYKKFLEPAFYGWQPEEKVIKRYRNEDDDGARWREIDLRKTGDNDLRGDRPNLFYYFLFNQKTKEFYPTRTEQIPDDFIQIKPLREDGREGNWRWELDTANKKIETLFPKLMPKKKVWSVFEMDYFEEGEKIKPTTAWSKKEFNSERGTETFIDLGFDKNDFPKPKPVGLLSHILEFATNENDIILDSFAGSGTTAHAVLELNKEDGGNRKFILIEQEDYANTITAERVRRVINGVETAKNEKLKNGLGGTFSYFKLGDAIEMESILRGETLPSFVEFARYIFYTATGEEFNEQAINENTGFIGSSKNHDVYMFYKPDIEWLKQNALTLNHVNEMPHKTANKMRLVFAPAKYVDDETCRVNRIDFCQLPYEIYRMV